MTYPDSVQFLYALGNEIKSAKLGLERIRAVLEALGNPERAYPRGACRRDQRQRLDLRHDRGGLRAANIRTGLFTSPHLIEPTERIQIDGIPVSPADFERAFNIVHETAEKLDLDCHPTYFETVTAMAFWLFREMRVHTAVIEVGLGGRLDSTNVVRTGPHRDHADRFRSRGVPGPHHRGHRRRKSRHPEARSARGLCAAASGSVSRAFRRARAELHVPVTRAEDFEIRDLHIDARGSRFSGIVCPLAGEHQVDNAVTAALALRALGMSPAGSPKPAGPGDWSTFLRIPTSSWTARTIRPARAPWRAISNDSMVAAGSGWFMARCATKPSRRSPASCFPSRASWF